MTFSDNNSLKNQIVLISLTTTLKKNSSNEEANNICFVPIKSIAISIFILVLTDTQGCH